MKATESCASGGACGTEVINSYVLCVVYCSMPKDPMYFAYKLYKAYKPEYKLLAGVYKLYKLRLSAERKRVPIPGVPTRTQLIQIIAILWMIEF